MTLKKIFVICFISIVGSTSLVIGLIGFQSYHLVRSSFQAKEINQLDSIFEVFQSEIIGSVLLNDPELLQSLFEEISKTKDISIEFVGPISVKTGELTPFLTQKTYHLRYGNVDQGEVTLAKKSEMTPMKLFADLVWILIVELFLLSVIVYTLGRYLKSMLFDPLQDLSNNIASDSHSILGFESFVADEVKGLAVIYNKMREQIRLRAKDEALTKIARQVAHDIRSPVGALQVLISRNERMDDSEKLLMSQVAKRINTIADDLLAKSRQSSGEKNRAPYHIKSLLKLVVDEMEIRVASEGVEFQVNIEEAASCYCEIDDSRFIRSISNFLNNALDAIQGANRKLVKILVEKDSDRLRISIVDSGGGMSAESLAKLGNRQYFTKKENGNGLGIQFSVGCIESFGGNVEFSNDESVGGLIVKISLPLIETPSWHINQIDTKRFRRVILIDDDLNVTSVVGNLFDKLKVTSIHETDQIKACYSDLPRVLSQMEGLRDDSLFLIDFDLGAVGFKGIDLITKYSLFRNAIIVSSSYQDVLKAIKNIPPGHEVKFIDKSRLREIDII